MYQCDNVHHLQILPSNSLLMYCIHSNNTIAFEVLLECEDLDIMWKNNTGANILQLLAKKGLLGLAQKCLKIVERKSYEQRDKFINNTSHIGEKKGLELYACVLNSNESFYSNDPYILTICFLDDSYFKMYIFIANMHFAMSTADVKMEIPVLVRQLKPSILSPTRFQLDNTFWAVVSVAVKQLPCSKHGCSETWEIWSRG